MLGTYLIEIASKKGVADPAAHNVAGQMKTLGFGQVERLESAQLYRIVGALTPEDRRRVASDLLADPVIQEFREGSWTEPQRPTKLGGKNPVVIDVWYKAGVTDSVGDSVLKAMADLGLRDIREVRTGARFRFVKWNQAKKADALAKSLLYNPLVQDAFIHAG